MTPQHRPAAQNRVPSSSAPDLPPAECQVVLASFWDYLDGNCSSALADRIDGHISSCLPCLRFRHFQERFFASMAEVRDRSRAPARVHDRVRKALYAARLETRPP